MVEDSLNKNKIKLNKFKNMEQYYRCVIKISYEDKHGNTKYKKESYLVFAMSPTDVEVKIQKFLNTSDYETISISLVNIVDVIK